MLVAALLATTIGVALGVLGGGGSILTVPLLVYVLGVEAKEAVATSLIVVGATSAVAAVVYARRGDVAWRIALLFAGAGMVGAFAGGVVARWLPGQLLLLLFAGIMLPTAAAMWRGRRPSSTATAHDAPRPARRGLRIVGDGLAVGVVTGLVGAGGGFLVVPALALLGGLDMRRAVGSSLVVIALKSFAGFAGYASHVDVDWRLAGVVTAAAVVGTLAGAHVAPRVPTDVLRKGFAVFVCTVAVFLLVRQL